MEEGGDVNWQSNSGRTALWKAAERGQRELVHLLYASGARLDLANKVGEHILFEVIKDPKLQDIAKDLLHLGIDLSRRDIEGNTVLHKACVLGNVDVVLMLIEAGVHLNSRNDYGNTALHNAAMFDKVPCMTCFLNFSASMILSQQNSVGQSALYLAMMHQNKSATMVLHDCGARLTDKERRNFKQYESSRSASKQDFWEWCVVYFRTPKTLSATCIATIRKVLHRPTVHSVRFLPIPKCLQNSLSLNDIKIS